MLSSEVTVHGQLWSTRRENTAFHIADIVVSGYEHIPGYKLLYETITNPFVGKPIEARLQSLH